MRRCGHHVVGRHGLLRRAYSNHASRRALVHSGEVGGREQEQVLRTPYGEAALRDGDDDAPALNCAARLMAASHDGYTRGVTQDVQS